MTIAALVLLLRVAQTASAADGGRRERPRPCAPDGPRGWDAASFPVPISASASDRLTRDLVVSDANTDAIQGTASGGLDTFGSSCDGTTTCP